MIELLVVIAVIAVLLAILVPVMSAAKERAQRAVCLSNLRQLTTAWIAYVDDHDGRIVYGRAGSDAYFGSYRIVQKAWLGPAFLTSENRSALLKAPNKGALWPYLQDIDIYRCPRWSGHFATYATVPAARGTLVEGTYQVTSIANTDDLIGKRIGATVLRLAKLTDISSPGAAERAVFLDQGTAPDSSDFYVYYLSPQWQGRLAPPTHHAKGMTLSMADGHAEYWKWKGRETAADLPRKAVSAYAGTGIRTVLIEDTQPKTEDGLYDLQRLQRITWGRLGYSVEESP
ncbi:MAG: type II secretion system protein [Phycisphaerales bacterium]